MRSWLSSNTIRYLLLTWLGTLLLQLVPMLQAHSIDWWDLGAQAIATAAAIIVRMAQPDINAPVDALNRRNPQP
jgi:hypothetical protein